jgi:hypothetical protein
LTIAGKKSNNPVMTLVEQIRTEAVGNDADLAVILRKCRVLAQRLKNEEFKQWVDSELDGYPNINALPKYRIIDCLCFGKFRYLSQGGESKSIQIPVLQVPQQYRKILFTMPFFDGVAVLRDLVNRMTDKHVTTGWEADYYALVGRGIFRDCELVEAWRIYPTSRVVGVLDSVRNRILKFVLEIERENPNAGDANMTGPPIPQQKVEQIFHTHITGNVGSIAVGSHSFSQTVIQQNDLDGLAKFIESIGGTKEDRKELEKAIEADGKPTGKSFGGKVAGWLGVMVSKAAQGTLKVGVDVASKVISEKLKQYYGI